MDAIFTTMEEWTAENTFNYGVFCLVPILLILVIAVWKKTTFSAILAGVLAACFMVAKFNPLVTIGLFMDEFYLTASDLDNIWVLVLCALFGSLIQLMADSGGVLGFTNIAKKWLNTRKKTLIGTWILGIIIFLDDYLNCLALGAATRPLTDEYKVSREMSSYIINSTGVTVCAIVPISSWGAFMSGLMEKSDLTNGLSAFSAYCHTVPFIFYAILAVVFVPLVALGIVPMFKNMKAAETRAIETGELLSEESKAAVIEGLVDEEKMAGKPKRALNFIIPIIVLVAMSIILDDMVVALVISIICCLILYLPQRLMTLQEFVDSAVKGICDMFSVLVMILICYMLIDLNDVLGFNNFVTAVCSVAVPAKLIPALIFAGIGMLSFTSGTIWGMAAITFPIVGAISAELGLNPFLMSGAVISAVAFGGHICLYSDTVILTSAATQCTCSDYFRTSLPIVLVYNYGLGILAFLIAGIVML